MNEKTIGAIIVASVIFVAIGGLFIVHQSSVGRSYEDFKGWVEFQDYSAALQRAIDSGGLNKQSAWDTMYSLIDKDRVCVTFVNIHSKAVAQEVVTNHNKARYVESVTRPDTFLILYVEKMPCTPVEFILEIDYRETRWVPSY